MSNFVFNFYPSNLFFDRCIEKSHNLMKRSWLTTIKTNEGTLLPCPFVVISLLHFSCFFCFLFILIDYPAKDCKAQCKLKKERYQHFKKFSYHILLQFSCASNSCCSFIKQEIRCTVCYFLTSFNVMAYPAHLVI